MQKVHTMISAAPMMLNLEFFLFVSILFFKVLFMVPSRYFTLSLDLNIFSLEGGPPLFEQKTFSYTLFYPVLDRGRDIKFIWKPHRAAPQESYLIDKHDVHMLVDGASF